MEKHLESFFRGRGKCASNQADIYLAENAIVISQHVKASHKADMSISLLFSEHLPVHCFIMQFSLMTPYSVLIQEEYLVFFLLFFDFHVKPGVSPQQCAVQDPLCTLLNNIPPAFSSSKARAVSLSENMTEMKISAEKRL